MFVGMTMLLIIMAMGVLRMRMGIREIMIMAMWSLIMIMGMWSLIMIMGMGSLRMATTVIMTMEMAMARLRFARRRKVQVVDKWDVHFGSNKSYRSTLLYT
jgi:hypothetical protein